MQEDQQVAAGRGGPGVALGGAAARDLQHPRGARMPGRDPGGAVAGAAVDHDHLIGLGDVQQRADLPGLVERRNDDRHRQIAHANPGERAVGQPLRKHALGHPLLRLGQADRLRGDEEVRARSDVPTERVPVDAVGRDA